MKDFRTLLNVGSVIMIILMVMSNYGAVISLENKEVLHIEIVISMLN